VLEEQPADTETVVPGLESEMHDHLGEHPPGT
jgi:hypothetical protein